jgi:hypothetical protein
MTMADMNGKSPAVMANDIIKAATEDKSVDISGTTYQKLEKIVRYDNRDKIQGKGETWFVKNQTRLTEESLDTLISNREKALTKYLDKKDNDDKRKSFLDLIARGVDYKKAVVDTGYNPDMDTEK